MWVSSKRLTDDVRRWRSLGWVTQEGEAKILDEVTVSGRGIGLAGALGILASVLLGVAAISFVAAHWQDMPRMLRLALMLGLIWAGYGAAGVFADRGQRMFADAAILFAVAMFGASIMLISQMFHIDGNPPDGMLLWAGGALLSGVALRCNPALALAMGLVAAWSGLETGQTGHVHWPFLGGWAAITAAFAWLRWRPGVHISGIALGGFVVTFGYLFNAGQAHTAVVAIGIMSAIAAISVAKLRPEFDDISAPALGYAIAVAFAGLFALQFVEDPSISRLVMLAAVTLALLLAAIWYGLMHANRGALWLGYIGFSIEILSVYTKTVGTLLDTSLFFLVAGLIVAALAYMAWRIASRSEPQKVPA